MRDLFEEIFTSIRKNKLRTFLTGFSIAWGIFMLIVLLASGNGLKNGMMSNFNFMSTNSLSIYPGRTTMPHKGLQKGRNVKFEMDDVEYLKNAFPSTVGEISPIINRWGYTISYEAEYTNTGIQGVYPDYKTLGNIEVKEGQGRFINLSDLKDERKIAIISEKTVPILFRNGKQPIGQYIKINKVPFLIAGVYTTKSGSQNPPVYIPFTTAKAIFNPSGRINNVSFVMKDLKTSEETKAFEEKLRERLGAKHQFNPKDQNAIWIWDRLRDFLQTQGIFNGINLFVWIIGIGTLIAGVVGISNIMLITVKERTHEFGIRKALGATPLSIISLVLIESVFITTIFGYIGMVFGVGLTELINYGMVQAAANTVVDQQKPTIFLNPTVDLNVVFAATGVLIIAGLIAGYVPAKRAVSIKPIDALRGE